MKKYFLIITIIFSSIFLSGCTIKREGIVNLTSINDCLELIPVKEDDILNIFRVFTCEYNKDKDNKIYSGECYNFQIQNGKCIRAYVFSVKPEYTCPKNSNYSYEGCQCNDRDSAIVNNVCVKINPEDTKKDNNLNIEHSTTETIDFSQKSETADSQFPKEKCVIEYGVKICDLSYAVKKNYADGDREISFLANSIFCINTTTGEQNQNQGNFIKINKENNFCVSDLGSIYIDPTIEVKKYFNQITREDYNSPYIISTKYEVCIWTYSDGNGAIPYMEISNNIGPSTGFDVRAFCKNGNKQVDIYSYDENNLN